jgi:predicted Rossmann fold nucleotide-binding protein DprA/Smf involved in DNA uptake
MRTAGREADATPSALTRSAAPLDPVRAAILDAVEAELGMDEVCAAAGLPVRETRAALSCLEASGHVRRDALGAYRRTAAPR